MGAGMREPTDIILGAVLSVQTLRNRWDRARAHTGVSVPLWVWLLYLQSSAVDCTCQRQANTVQSPPMPPHNQLVYPLIGVPRAESPHPHLAFVQ